VSGRWISSAQVASHMILLARTTPLEDVPKPSSGLSLFFIPLHRDRQGLSMSRIPKMGGRAIDANEVFFDNYRVPASSLIGTEGQGFKIVLHGMNAERCLLAGEALGLGYVALKRAANYARERVVFDRPIGMNQGIQHPLADAYMQLEGAKLATYHAARLYDQSGKNTEITQEAVGVACNSAKYLAAEAAFKACERAVREICSTKETYMLNNEGSDPWWNGIFLRVSRREILTRVLRSSHRSCKQGEFLPWKMRHENPFSNAYRK
jgi:acyl-CoA dehydrogenase